MLSSEEGINTRRGLGDAGERLLTGYSRRGCEGGSVKEMTDGNDDLDRGRIDEPVSRTGIDRDRTVWLWL
jgi:hypothetical protein